MDCLFLIDVQNGFVSPRTAHVVPRLIRLAENFRRGPILATRFINTDGGPYERFMGWQRLKTSPETDLLPEIAAAAGQVVEKTVYSACTPPVVEFLRRQNITRAYLAGIDTDCCVLKTATDLFELGIRPVVLVDCCASNGGPRSHEAAITVLERTIGRAQLYRGELPPEEE